MEAQQTPMRTAIMRIMSDMLDNPNKDGICETGRFMDNIEQLLCDMMVAPESMELSGSESIFGFMAWLTTRNATTVIGPHQEVDISLIEDFRKYNKMREPREMWAELLTHPPEPDSVDVDKPVDRRELDFIVSEGVDAEIIDIFGEQPIADEVEENGVYIVRGTLEEALAFIVGQGIHKSPKK